MSKINRRNLFRAAAGIPVLTAAGSATSSSSKVRNIIFMVADGMSPGVLPLGEIFSEITRGRGTAWAALQRGSGAVSGLLDEASLNADVTD